MSDQRISVYKCVVDDGGAPCVDDSLLTLAICKPYIRSTAKQHDLIFAFGSNSETPANRLVYITEVKDRLDNGQYFEREGFKKRRDCIYKRAGDGRFERCVDAKFHNYPEARISDLGDEPDYPKANTLVAEDFRYFGKRGTASWKSHAPNLRELVEGLGRGYRVNFSPELLAELVALKKQVWRDNPSKKVLGKPLHAPDEQIDSDFDELVKLCKGRCYYVPKAKKC